jgi:protein TonB
MFDTSIVRGHSSTAERNAGLFTLSIAFHSAIIVAALAAGLRATGFPDHPPNQMELFRFHEAVTLPPALGSDHPGSAKPAPAQQAHPVPAIPSTPVAPNTVPEAIPTVAQAQSDPGNQASTGGEAGTGGTGSGPLGVPWGSPIGIGDAPAANSLPDAAGPLVISGDVKPPVAIHRVQPVFPEIARRAHKGGVVTLLCVIDKSGAVVNARVVNSSFAAFDQPALDAVRQWRFVSGSLHGRPVDTFFELTVTFTLQ